MVTTEADINICNPLAPGGHNTHPTVTLGARWVQKVKVYCKSVQSQSMYSDESSGMQESTCPSEWAEFGKNQSQKLIWPSWKLISSFQAGLVQLSVAFHDYIKQLSASIHWYVATFLAKECQIPVPCCDTSQHWQSATCWENSMVTTEADMNICNPLAPGGHNTHPTVTLGARWVQKVKVYCKSVQSQSMYSDESSGMQESTCPSEWAEFGKNQSQKLIRPSWKLFSSFQAGLVQLSVAFHDYIKQLSASIHWYVATFLAKECQIPVPCCDTSQHWQSATCWENSMVTTEADINICNPLAPGGHNTHPTVTLGARWVQKVKVYCKSVQSQFVWQISWHAKKHLPVRVSWVW